MRISDWSSDVCSSDLSQQARRQLAELGIDSSYAPYAVDRNQFRPIGDRGQLSALRDRYEIPSGRYLIGSFQRDSVASDLVSPTLVKRPAAFCKIIRHAMDLCAPVHEVLTGPRRTWICSRLQTLRITYTL